MIDSFDSDKKYQQMTEKSTISKATPSTVVNGSIHELLDRLIKEGIITKENQAKSQEIANQLVQNLNSKQKKTKKTRDPSKPKGAKNSYMYFLELQRENIKSELTKAHCEQHPDPTDPPFTPGVAEIAKEAGKRWKVCLDKTEYEALASKDKSRFNEEMETWKATHQ